VLCNLDFSLEDSAKTKIRCTQEFISFWRFELAMVKLNTAKLAYALSIDTKINDIG